MLPIIIVWVVAIALGGFLFARFTRAPGAAVIAPPGGERVPVRRVYPLWLVLVLLIILVLAIWFTLHFGTLAYT